ncbi:MAG TPA: hypothetical protein VI112_04135 [Bacteroidia bacterium]|jgi:Na+/H+-translocating membrane pyrophosphatase
MKGAKRPALISIACIIGFLWITCTFPGVFSPSIKKIGDWAPAIYGFIIASSFISFVGIWHMKKWGVHLYVITISLKESFFFSIDYLDILSIIGIVFSVIFIIIFTSYYSRMSVNL